MASECMKKMNGSERKHHFLLVHGGCHGAWSWYKLFTLLRAAGHRVTALDMASCGVDTKPLDQVHSIVHYHQPLTDFMASAPAHGRVVLVGHSSGGIGVSLAMERFPRTISVAIFATAMMPSLVSPPGNMIKEMFRRLDSMMDCRATLDQGPDSSPSTFIFGPMFLASKVYQCCQPEDLTLATMLVRPGKPFGEDMSREIMVSEENYGSVSRVYIVSKEDELLKADFQHWIIENNPPREVRAIHGSDHMPMLSKPQELCCCLLYIADRYD